MKAKYKAIEIARWFVNRAHLDVGEAGGEYLSHLKLQKLLYYAQGCYLALENEPLFNEAIYAWAHGPVVEKVYQYYKSFGDNCITEVEEVSIDEETVAILEEVYKAFGCYSAWALRNMTHEERPWKETRQSGTIDLDLLKSFFLEKYIVD